MQVIIIHKEIMEAVKVANVELEPLLNPEQAAPHIGKSCATIKADISRRPQSLPPFLKVGRKLYFRPSDILAWRETCVVRSGSTPTEPIAANTKTAGRVGRPTKVEAAKRRSLRHAGSACLQMKS